MSAQLPEYVENLRALLRLDAKRWRLVVERQVMSQVLPGVEGNRSTLEPHLWSLLVLCLNGHEAATPELTDESWERARQAAADGRSLSSDDAAAYPRAAVEVAMVLFELREVGVYPPPKVGKGQEEAPER